MARGLVFFALISSVCASCLMAQSGFSREAFHEQQKLSWEILQAQAQGEAQVVLSGGMQFFSEVEGLDAELAESTAVLVTPVEQLTEIYHDDSLATWYRLKVVETIAASPLAVRERPLTEQLDREMPLAIRPRAGDELVIRRSGGTLQVDGITVVAERTPFRALALGSRYLIFCALDPALRIAIVSLQNDGVYRMIDGDAIVPTGSTNFSVARDLREVHGNSLRRLREHIAGLGKGTVPQ